MPKIFKTVNFDFENRVSITGPVTAGPPVAAPALEPEVPEVVEPEKPEAPAEVSFSPSEAQRHVEFMMQQAQLQVAGWKEEAHRAGWEAGHSEGQKRAEAEAAETLKHIQRVAESVLEAKAKFLASAQAELGQLAVAIARKIIGRELSLNPKVISDIVARSIKLAQIKGACRIRVHPTDYELLAPMWEAIPSFQQPSQMWELVPDEQVSRGGCLIEVSGGTVDGQLEAQLAQIAAAFEDIELGV
jgi:flagellar assembly protein FliH